MEKQNAKKIEMNYKKAAYFNIVFPVISKIVNFEAENISEFNFNNIKIIKK